MIERVENRWVPGVLKSASRFLYYVGYLPFIDLVRPLMGTSSQDYIGGKEAADSLKYTMLANKHLARRIQMEDDMKKGGQQATRKDTFHYLLRSEDSLTGRKPTVEELQADSALIIAAGSDGVGLTVAAALFYLVRSPSALSKLTTEIRSAFASAADIKNPKLGSLPYLSACIDETLRMNPPKPSALPREVLAGGMLIDGHHIPRGTEVGTPIYVLHHDADLYPEPWAFRPERWIGDPTAGVGTEHARRGFCPFLVGPMNCVGKNMAYIAIKLALAHLLFRYDVWQAGSETGGGGGPDLEEGRERAGEYQMPVIQVKSRVE